MRFLGTSGKTKSSFSSFVDTPASAVRKTSRFRIHSMYTGHKHGKNAFIQRIHGRDVRPVRDGVKPKKRLDFMAFSCLSRNESRADPGTSGFITVLRPTVTRGSTNIVNDIIIIIFLTRVIPSQRRYRVPSATDTGRYRHLRIPLITIGRPINE